MYRLLVAGILLFSMAFAPGTSLAQPYITKVIDVQSYQVQLDMSNFKKDVNARNVIRFKVLQTTDRISFDFKSPQSKKEGMELRKIIAPYVSNWKHENDRIEIECDETLKEGQEYEIMIYYAGMPMDGLVISKNKHKDATAFGDNWPNRAHHWFPCTDHPSDKATVSFEVIYPNEYRVVANGLLQADAEYDKRNRRAVWESSTVLPTKVMVIGLAPFSVSEPCHTHDIEVNSWVFQQQEKEGFHDYEPACDILDWFIEKMGDYPFEKLANVQSKTRYGGMENASCIFYYEESVTGNQEVNRLIAHEIAHQWFGNCVSELDWEHIWLSEGFATYLTDLYILEHEGEEAFVKQMEVEKNRVTQFYKRYKAPVVDTLVPNINMLLNANSYQKGAWVLHMLRQKVGDDNFWKGLRLYYQRFQYGNAQTTDFRKVMEEVSGQDLKAFFKQWLYTQGHPQLEVSWKNLDNGKLEIHIQQMQEGLFEIEVPLHYSDGTKEGKEMLELKTREASFVVETMMEGVEISINPEMNVLLEVEVSKK